MLDLLLNVFALQWLSVPLPSSQLRLVGRTRLLHPAKPVFSEAFPEARLKDESQRPQEMRYRCIMAGFDPDTPEEMQEFIRVSTLCIS